MENFISPLRFKKSNYVIRLFSNDYHVFMGQFTLIYTYWDDFGRSRPLRRTFERNKHANIMLDLHKKIVDDLSSRFRP